VVTSSYTRHGLSVYPDHLSHNSLGVRLFSIHLFRGCSAGYSNRCKGAVARW